MSSRARRAQGLAELRALKGSGKTRLATYSVEDDNAIYDEVDDAKYNQLLRDRLQDDDFVVGDNGEGYVDTGVDEWDDGNKYYSDEEEIVGGGRKRSKKADKDVKKSENNHSLNSLFKKHAAVTPAPKKAKVSTAEDDSFLDDILGELDSNTASRTSMKSKPSLRGPTATPTPFYKQSRQNLSPTRMRPQVPSSPPTSDREAMTDITVPSSDSKYVSAEEEEGNDLSSAKSKPEFSDDEDDEEMLSMSRPIAVESSSHVNIASTRAAPPSSGGIPSDDIDVDGWSKMRNSVGYVTEDPQFVTHTSHDEFVDPQGPDTFNFFWTDYAEVDGSLLLFGKAPIRDSSKFASGCIQIKGLQKRLYFLPRHNPGESEPVDIGQVHHEVVEIIKRRAALKSVRTRFVNKKYAFEVPGVPREAQYLEVLLPFDDSSTKNFNVKSGETFSHVFGNSTGMFEEFVISHGVMGPCWLKVSNAKFGTITDSVWVQMNATVDSPKLVEPIKEGEDSPPPMTILSLSVRTVMNDKDHKQEITAISSRVYKDIAHDLTTPLSEQISILETKVRPVDSIFPAGFEKLIAEDRKGQSIKTYKTETALLNSFLTNVQKYDPDVIIGHQLENVHLSILIHRLKDLKCRFFDKMGRMRRSNWPQAFGKSSNLLPQRQILTGRLMCDISGTFGRSATPKCDSWSLTEMSDLYLGVNRMDYDIDAKKFRGIETAEGLYGLLTHNEQDTYYSAALTFKSQLLALSKQLTNLAGNSWSKTLGGSRVDRNEYILLHEFTNQGYIVPDKQEFTGKGNQVDAAAAATVGPSKAKYQGGLVFEPEKGLYKSIILVMDFNSLYPSIIQEYNICFTTVDRSNADDQNLPSYPSSKELGIFPRLIENLVQRRRQVKNNMKDPQATPALKAQWDIKQSALKLTANSMYGCLGFPASRFYALPLAAMITSKGREILTSTKELAEDKSLKVVYGDTDSVMVNTGVTEYEEARKVGNEFKKEVNSRYKKLEIDIDNMYQYLLLTNKKKYAAVNMMLNSKGAIDTAIEVKGLDLKRREFCQLSKEVSMFCLDRILSADEIDTTIEKIHEYLRGTLVKMKEGKIGLGKYLIRNKLSKDPSQYPDGSNLPHVQVALRKQQKGEIVKSDDVISFIITKGEENKNLPTSMRAYTFNEVKSKNLEVDIDYYLTSQILPPVDRICTHVEGMDKFQLMECLGIDTSKFAFSNNNNKPQDTSIQPLETQISDEERFKDVRRFQVSCRCGDEFVFEGISSNVTAEGIKCPKCHNVVNPERINVQLELFIRKEIGQYYQGWIVCDDPSCKAETRQINVYGRKCVSGNQCQGIMSYKYTDRMIYNQLLYLDRIFDVTGSKSPEEKALSEYNRARFEVTRAVVDKYLSNCGRRYVNMHNIFGYM